MAQRRLGWCLVAAVIWGAAAVLPAAEKEKGPYIGPAEAFQNKETIAEKLATDIDFKFVETPLKDVVSLLQDVIGTTVLLNATKLEEAAVSIDTPITLELQGLQLRSALRLLLDDLNLAYVDRKQYLMITTPEDAESSLEIRIYDVRELLTSKNSGEPQGKRDAPNVKPPARQLDEAGKPTRVPADIMPQFGGQMPQDLPPRDPLEVDAERLIELIQQLIAPQSWDYGSGPASARQFKGLIIVSQTSQIQEEVERLLSMLHEANGLPAKALKVIR